MGEREEKDRGQIICLRRIHYKFDMGSMKEEGGNEWQVRELLNIYLQGAEARVNRED